MKDPPNEEPGKGILHMIDVTGMADVYVPGYTHRKFCTTMPTDYDSTKPYPVVFYGPGCGATACEGSSFSGKSDVFVVQAIAGADATGGVQVPKSSAPGCFQAGKEGTADSPEGPYFDQVMAMVEANYCVDRGKIYAAGTSSGAWLSNYLACARGNRVRGTAADSGGLQFDHGTCTGGAAVMNLPGDAGSSHDQAGHEIGAAQARDMYIELNGCNKTPTPMSFGKANNCDFYGGCANPVVWCNVGGGHQSGNGQLYDTGMAFWKTLQ
jgi:poly(3-hydroxybutyrate) depolymerase